MEVATVFSHLVGADDSQHNAFSQQQFATFMAGAERIEQMLGRSVTKHLLNSAGIVRFPDYQLDMVRVGIGLYGVEASGTEMHRLQPIGRLTTVISQIKTLDPGQTVGYGRKGQVTRPTRIGTIAIGYADGYDRRFGNGVGRVWVNGTLCPTIGNVCMDMTMIDLREAEVQEGDEVVVFGPELPLTELAESLSTIPYEILTGIGERVKRVFSKE
jgi:alanine racemase